MGYTIQAGAISFTDLVRLAADHNLKVDVAYQERFAGSQALVRAKVTQGQRIYGVNTGFGKLADAVIPMEQLAELQHRLILSTAAGYGALLPDETVRLCLILKVNALAQGYSGVRTEVVQALLTLLNNNAYPCVPAKGSVGASGDLAPLAHLFLQTEQFIVRDKRFILKVYLLKVQPVKISTLKQVTR